MSELQAGTHDITHTCEGFHRCFRPSGGCLSGCCCECLCGKSGETACAGSGGAAATSQGEGGRWKQCCCGWIEGGGRSGEEGRTKHALPMKSPPAAALPPSILQDIWTSLCVCVEVGYALGNCVNPSRLLSVARRRTNRRNDDVGALWPFVKCAVVVCVQRQRVKLSALL